MQWLSDRFVFDYVHVFQAPGCLAGCIPHGLPDLRGRLAVFAEVQDGLLSCEARGFAGALSEVSVAHYVFSPPPHLPCPLCPYSLS